MEKRPCPIPTTARLWPVTFCLLAQAAAAQPDEAGAATLPPVAVSAGLSDRRGADAPFALTVVDAEAIRRAGPMVNLSEALARVPGLSIHQRQNHAQDLQINSRGFGARTPFGVRGLRLHTDGIPASMPDGQGQVNHFDLAGAERIEVLRGPFSALHGSSSGGVILLTSAAPSGRAWRADADAGSDGLRQWRLGAEAPLGGGWDLRLQGSRFETDGPRPHSQARRDLLNLRVGWRGASDTVTLLLNSVDQPAQDPLGLSRRQWAEGGPGATTPQALQFDTRKQSRQTQLGGAWKHRFEGAGALDRLQLTAYAGRRSVTQWQAIPVAAQQASPTHPGGVVDFDRGYGGVDARLAWRWALDAERIARLVAGVAVEEQDEDRRGFENFLPPGPGASNAAAPRLGVTGALRRDERNTARATDAYLQAEWDLRADVSATLGARTGRLTMRSRDFYTAGTNGDDSGRLAFDYTTPVATLQWRASPSLNLYAGAGRGFESPTLAELAYGPQPGFNRGLRPQRSRQFEVGAKWREGGSKAQGEGLSMDFALFHIATRDEIGVLGNNAGRSTYQNVGRTTRRGAELGGEWHPAPRRGQAWRAEWAVTWLDATYRDGFDSPGGRVAAGGRIAGTAEKSLFAAVAWLPRPALEAAVELRAQGRVPVNDLNSDFAPGAGVWALRLVQSFDFAPGRLQLLARVDNLADRRYVGSVIVNEGNGRYFEPAAGRAWLIGARWRQPF